MEGEGEEVQEEATEAGGAAVRKRKRVGGEDSTDELEGSADDEAEGADEGGGVYGKVLLGEDDEEGGIAEEAVAEVMRWLELEIADDNNVSLPPPAAQDDAGFVTINGYEESCGPSFSAAASTVMASVDTRAGMPPPPTVPWPWPEPQPETETVLPAAPSVDVDVDVVETEEPADEEWLVRLLTCGALLEGVL